MRIQLPEVKVRILPSIDNEDIRIILFQGSPHEKANILGELNLSQLLGDYYNVAEMTEFNQLSYAQRPPRKKECIESLKYIIGQIEGDV